MRFPKTVEKVHWASTGYETQFSPKFGAKLNSPSPFFAKRLQPITAVFTVTKNVLERRAFNPESQHFIPLFNKISLLCGQHPEKDEASNDGCNSSSTKRDFTDHSNIPTSWSILGPTRELSLAPNIMNDISIFFLFNCWVFSFFFFPNK